MNFYGNFYGIPEMNDTLNKLHAQVQMMEKCMGELLKQLEAESQLKNKYSQLFEVYKHAKQSSFKLLEERSQEFDKPPEEEEDLK